MKTGPPGPSRAHGINVHNIRCKGAQRIDTPARKATEQTHTASPPLLPVAVLIRSWLLPCRRPPSLPLLLLLLHPRRRPLWLPRAPT